MNQVTIDISEIGAIYMTTLLDCTRVPADPDLVFGAYNDIKDNKDKENSKKDVPRSFHITLITNAAIITTAVSGAYNDFYNMSVKEDYELDTTIKYSFQEFLENCCARERFLIGTKHDINITNDLLSSFIGTLMELYITLFQEEREERLELNNLGFTARDVIEGAIDFDLDESSMAPWNQGDYAFTDTQRVIKALLVPLHIEICRIFSTSCLDVLKNNEIFIPETTCYVSKTLRRLLVPKISDPKDLPRIISDNIEILFLEGLTEEQKKTDETVRGVEIFVELIESYCSDDSQFILNKYLISSFEELKQRVLINLGLAKEETI